jgi:hypothetical protein
MTAPGIEFLQQLTHAAHRAGKFIHCHRNEAPVIGPAEPAGEVARLPLSPRTTQTERRPVGLCQAGAVVTYQLLPKLQIGAEIFHQTADSSGTPATSSLGIGWRFDLSDNCHPLRYLRRGIENANETDRYSWYASVLFTF